MWRLIYAVPSWILFTFLINLPLIIIGWVLVPIAALCNAYESYQGFDGVGAPRVQYRFTWPFMWVWDNYEDGIANDTYVKFDSMFMKIVYWSCLRNPVNNLRIVPYLSCKIEPKKVGFTGSYIGIGIEKYDTKIPNWFFTWHGLYTSFWWQFNLFGKLRRLWIGWAIYPTDIYGVTKYRERGAGFKTQFKVIK